MQCWKVNKRWLGSRLKPEPTKDRCHSCHSRWKIALFTPDTRRDHSSAWWPETTTTINNALTTHPAAPVMIAFLPWRRPPSFVLAIRADYADRSCKWTLDRINQERQNKKLSVVLNQGWRACWKLYHVRNLSEDYDDLQHFWIQFPLSECYGH